MGRLGWSGLAEIEGPDIAAKASDRKTAAAQVAGTRSNHGQRKGGSHRRVGSVSASAENLESGLRRRRSGTRDGPTRTPFRLRVRCTKRAGG